MRGCEVSDVVEETDMVTWMWKVVVAEEAVGV